MVLSAVRVGALYNKNSGCTAGNCHYDSPKYNLGIVDCNNVSREICNLLVLIRITVTLNSHNSFTLLSILILFERGFIFTSKMYSIKHLFLSEDKT